MYIHYIVIYNDVWYLHDMSLQRDYIIGFAKHKTMIHHQLTRWFKVPKSRCFGHLTIRGMDVLWPAGESSCACPEPQLEQLVNYEDQTFAKSMVTWHNLNMFSILIWTENIKMRIIQYNLTITFLHFDIIILVMCEQVMWFFYLDNFLIFRFPIYLEPLVPRQTNISGH